jgi:hypothetical protein
MRNFFVTIKDYQYGAVFILHPQMTSPIHLAACGHFCVYGGVMCCPCAYTKSHYTSGYCRICRRTPEEAA